MWRQIQKLSLLFLLLLCVLLSGCRADIPESDRLSALMTDVNAEHRTVRKPAIDADAVLAQLTHDPSRYSLDTKVVGPMQNGVLTAAQAKNDTNYLMYQLQTQYGLYDYLGGDAVFNAARDRVFQACDACGMLTPDSFADLLLKEFSFITDMHFFIGRKQPGLLVIPYQYREIAFEKDEQGYRIFGKQTRVASVAGYDDLDALFRRSISDDGHLVYYPTVLQSAPVADSIALLRGTAPDSSRGVPPDLEIRYENGTTRYLSAGTVSFGNDSERATVELYENQSVPVLYSRKMAFDDRGDADGQAFFGRRRQALRRTGCHRGSSLQHRRERVPSVQVGGGLCRRTGGVQLFSNFTCFFRLRLPEQSVLCFRRNQGEILQYPAYRCQENACRYTAG